MDGLRHATKHAYWSIIITIIIGHARACHAAIKHRPDPWRSHMVGCVGCVGCVHRDPSLARVMLAQSLALLQEETGHMSGPQDLSPSIPASTQPHSSLGPAEDHPWLDQHAPAVGGHPDHEQQREGSAKTSAAAPGEAQPVAVRPRPWASPGPRTLKPAHSRLGFGRALRTVMRALQLAAAAGVGGVRAGVEEGEVGEGQGPSKEESSSVSGRAQPGTVTAAVSDTLLMGALTQQLLVSARAAGGLGLEGEDHRMPLHDATRQQQQDRGLSLDDWRCLAQVLSMLGSQMPEDLLTRLLHDTGAELEAAASSITHARDEPLAQPITWQRERWRRSVNGRLLGGPALWQQDEEEEEAGGRGAGVGGMGQAQRPMRAHAFDAAGVRRAAAASSLLWLLTSRLQLDRPLPLPWLRSLGRVLSVHMEHLPGVNYVSLPRAWVAALAPHSLSQGPAPAPATSDSSRTAVQEQAGVGSTGAVQARHGASSMGAVQARYGAAARGDAGADAHALLVEVLGAWYRGMATVGLGMRFVQLTVVLRDLPALCGAAWGGGSSAGGGSSTGSSSGSSSSPAEGRLLAAQPTSGSPATGPVSTDATRPSGQVQGQGSGQPAAPGHGLQNVPAGWRLPRAAWAPRGFVEGVMGLCMDLALAAVHSAARRSAAAAAESEAAAALAAQQASLGLDTSLDGVIDSVSGLSEAGGSWSDGAGSSSAAGPYVSPQLLWLLPGLASLPAEWVGHTLGGQPLMGRPPYDAPPLHYQDRVQHTAQHTAARHTPVDRLWLDQYLEAVTPAVAAARPDVLAAARDAVSQLGTTVPPQWAVHLLALDADHLPHSGNTAACGRQMLQSAVVMEQAGGAWQLGAEPVAPKQQPTGHTPSFVRVPSVHQQQGNQNQAVAQPSVGGNLPGLPPLSLPKALPVPPPPASRAHIGVIMPAAAASAAPQPAPPQGTSQPQGPQGHSQAQLQAAAQTQAQGIPQPLLQGAATRQEQQHPVSSKQPDSALANSHSPVSSRSEGSTLRPQTQGGAHDPAAAQDMASGVSIRDATEHVEAHEASQAVIEAQQQVVQQQVPVLGAAVATAGSSSPGSIPSEPISMSGPSIRPEPPEVPLPSQPPAATATTAAATTAAAAATATAADVTATAAASATAAATATAAAATGTSHPSVAALLQLCAGTGSHTAKKQMGVGAQVRSEQMWEHIQALMAADGAVAALASLDGADTVALVQGLLVHVRGAQAGQQAGGWQKFAGREAAVRAFVTGLAMRVASLAPVSSSWRSSSQSSSSGTSKGVDCHPRAGDAVTLMQQLQQQPQHQLWVPQLRVLVSQLPALAAACGVRLRDSCMVELWAAALRVLMTNKPKVLAQFGLLPAAADDQAVATPDGGLAGRAAAAGSAPARERLTPEEIRDAKHELVVAALFGACELGCEGAAEQLQPGGRVVGPTGAQSVATWSPESEQLFGKLMDW